jgi:MFS family permease
MNGYDGSLFGGLTSNSNFLTFFNGTKDGTWAALNSAMYQIGSVCALPFVGPAIDTWGRKTGMQIGVWIIIIGVILNGTTLQSHKIGMLQGGRFLLGFGVNIVSSAGPIYVVETAHPSWRAIITAYCNTFWFTGSILAGGAVRGGLNLGGNRSWQLPVWLQIFFPGIIAGFVWLIPESPRWLYVNNRRDQAVATLTKWHGYGNPDSAWVKLQTAEYEEFLNLNGADKRFWDYRVLFNTRASRYRLACNCVFSIFCQWAGNGVLTYFLPAVLSTAGYTADVTQANINLGYACFQFAFALLGAAFVERVGRRPLFLFSMGACCLMWVGMTVASALFARSSQSNTHAAEASIAFVFLFGAVFSFGLTPLQALYPVEVLSYEMRAKGMAFSGFSVAIGGLLNQFAWPISLKQIGWWV